MNQTERTHSFDSNRQGAPLPNYKFVHRQTSRGDNKVKWDNLNYLSIAFVCTLQRWIALEIAMDRLPTKIFVVT